MQKSFIVTRPMRSWAVPIVAILASIAVVPKTGRADAENEYAEPAAENRIPLQIAVVANAPKTTLAFTLTNNRKQDLEVTPVGINLSRIIVVNPDGKRVEMVADVAVLKMGIVKPSASATWKVEIDRELKAYDMTEPGLYRLYWGLIEWVTDEKKVEHKSNEIPILIE